MSLASTPPPEVHVRGMTCTVCREHGITAPHTCPVQDLGINIASRGPLVAVAPGRWRALADVVVTTCGGATAVPKGHDIKTADAWTAVQKRLPCDFIWSASMVEAYFDGRPTYAVSHGNDRYAAVGVVIAQTALMRCVCGSEFSSPDAFLRHVGAYGVLRPVQFDELGQIHLGNVRCDLGVPEMTTLCCSQTRTLGCRHQLCTHWVKVSVPCTDILTLAGIPPDKGKIFRGLALDDAVRLMLQMMSSDRQGLQRRLGLPVVGPVLKILQPISAAPVFAKWAGDGGEWPGGELRYVAVIPRPEAEASIAEMQLLLGLLKASTAQCCCGQCLNRRCFKPLVPLAAALGVTFT